MKKIVFGFCTLTVIAWLVNLMINPPAMNGKSIVHEVFYLNGVLALGLMAMAITIAARPACLERITRTPLDELYKWHRLIGIWAAVFALWHFFSKTLTAPILSLMTLEPAARAARTTPVGWDAFWSSLRSFAITSSEWAILIGLLLFILCFVTYVRYDKWFMAHKLFSVLFLIFAIHGIRLMDTNDLFTPFGLINVGIVLIGCLYSIRLLLFGAGHQKSVKGHIVAIQVQKDLTLIDIKPVKDFRIEYGQFVFLAKSGCEKHPFSVAGINDDGTLSFAVKALGDYTRESVPEFKCGDEVILEGPWGKFIPDFAVKKQLWFAGGVGVAPFCAWLQVAAKSEHGPIRLVWCINSKEDEPMYCRVAKLAESAGVDLEVYESSKTRLNIQTLFEDFLPETVALCSGEKLAQAVIKAYLSSGGDPGNIRKEHFSWR